MHIRKPYDPHKRVMQEIGENHPVQEHLAPETDINNIMAKYRKTGVLSHVKSYAGQYGDFSGVPDYKTGLERILAADEMFSSLPAAIRRKFDNDPAEFIEFATNPDNLEEMRKMGLAPPASDAAERPSLGAKSEAEDQPTVDPKKPAPAKGDQ